VKKIRDIGPKIKKIRDVSGEGNDREIREITASEVPMDESVSAVLEESNVPAVRSTSSAAPVLDSGSIERQEKERVQESRLYEARGTTLRPTSTRSSGSEEREYAPIENLQADRMKSAGIGRDFAMGQQRSLLPEGQTMQTASKIRDDSDSEKKYAEGLKEGGGDRKRRRMPWEI